MLALAVWSGSAAGPGLVATSEQGFDAAYPSNVTDEPEPGVAERAHRRQEERWAALRGDLRADEQVVARGPIVVTDRRVLFAWNDGFGWRSDAVAFEEARRWALGRRHDGRPVVRIEHPTHERMEQVRERRVVGPSWENTEASVPHEDVTLCFRAKRDPTLIALLQQLSGRDVPRGNDFVVALPKSGEERTKPSRAYFRRRR
jgi:hypothetical protein